MQRLPLTHHLRQRQRGVALFVVIVVVMLSMLLALWASRTSLFNEMLVGNDADYQRAFEAAQALLQDAELDIRGEKADGSPCSGSGDVCRTSTIDKIPLEDEINPEGTSVTDLLTTLRSQTPTQCRNGLCAKRTGKQDFWNNTDASKGPTLAQMKAVGARYGQFTGAAIGSSDAPANPILADRSEPVATTERGGWYWIEVLPYAPPTDTDDIGDPDPLDTGLIPRVIYRITALAYGQRSTTMVVLQQTYARKKTKD